MGAATRAGAPGRTPRGGCWGAARRRRRSSSSASRAPSHLRLGPSPIADETSSIHSPSMSTEGAEMTPQEVVVDEVTAVTPEILDALRTLVPELSASAPPLTETALEEIVRSPATVLLVARDGTGGAVLGSLTLVVFSAPTGPRAWIEDVVVATGGPGPWRRRRARRGGQRARRGGRIPYRGPHIPPVARSGQPAVCAPRVRPAPDQRLPQDPRLTTSRRARHETAARPAGARVGPREEERDEDAEHVRARRHLRRRPRRRPRGAGQLRRGQAR